MLEYVYIVKCPSCADEHFYFFNEAKDYAMSSLSSKPIIIQVEVNRNDFGECTDSVDLGTIWSWEDMMSDDEPAKSVFTKDDLRDCNCDGTCGGDCKCRKYEEDPEFAALDNSLDEVPDNFRKLPADSKNYSESLLEPGKQFSEREIAQIYQGAKECFEDASNTESFWYHLGFETAAFDDTFSSPPIAVLPDHLTEDDAEYKDFARGYKDNGGNVRIAAEESITRKPVPEDMSIEDLVEAMEENEDEVECKSCNELFNKEDCDYSSEVGWRCKACQAPITESFDSTEMIELEYPELTVTLFGPKRDVDDWDEVEHTTSHTFLVPKVDVAVAIWENWITEEDVKDVEGGLETLEDDILWEQFLETHFDELFEKYHQQVLKYFEEDAIEDFRESSQEEYDQARWSASSKPRYYLEELEEPNTYSERLADCPECGVTQSFDHETGICISCGFSI